MLARFTDRPTCHDVRVLGEVPQEVLDDGHARLEAGLQDPILEEGGQEGAHDRHDGDYHRSESYGTQVVLEGHVGAGQDGSVQVIFVPESLEY